MTSGEAETPGFREQMSKARQALSGHGPLVVLSGAGMSAESGVPTFRDAQTGLWERYDPTDLATPEAWRRDRDMVWAWYRWREHLISGARPNPGHLAVARAQDHRDVVVVTQNVDDLHERAGSERVSHLHGSLFSYRCAICHKPARTPEFPDQQLERVTPPNCSLCGNPVRPGVVWFGEPLPHREWDASEAAMREADLVVIIGTSGVVYPAAGLPQVAKAAGARILEISPDRTDLTRLADWSLRATAAEGAPAIVAAAN